jgi:hypothetical protein
MVRYRASQHHVITSSRLRSRPALYGLMNFILEEFENREKAYGEARIRLCWGPGSRDVNGFETRFKMTVKSPNLKTVPICFCLTMTDQIMIFKRRIIMMLLSRIVLVWHYAGVVTPRVGCRIVLV